MTDKTKIVDQIYCDLCDSFFTVVDAGEIVRCPGCEAPFGIVDAHLLEVVGALKSLVMEMIDESDVANDRECAYYMDKLSVILDDTSHAIIKHD